MNKEFYWNFNEQGEYWSNTGDTIEGCLIDAREEVKDFEEEEGLEKGEIQSVFIGELDKHNPKICIERVIDDLIDSAWEECGEVADSFLNGIKNEEKEMLDEKLNEVLNEWLEDTNNLPGFGSIEDIREYNLKTGKEVI